MINELKKINSNAYAPYSNYKVSAIVVMKDGNRFSGVNVENASYGASICAERNAINNAIANGYKKSDFKEIHIMNSTENIGMPCMLCRQVFVEMFSLDVNIFVYDINGNVKNYSMNELCTFPFSGDDLK